MKNYKIAIVIGILLFVFIALFLTDKVFLKSPSNNNECEIISENSGADKIDIVFLTDSVSKEKTSEYIKELVENEPFSFNAGKFNFYYAGNTDCKIVQGNILFCYSKETVKKSAVCENDFVVVLSSKGNLRSSAYGDVISLNVNQQKSVFLHEFGHVFANLADEYVPSEIPRGSKNCASDCKKFELSEGCFLGCSKDSLFRSSEASVMRTLSTSNYGKLNTELINRRIEKYE